MAKLSGFKTSRVVRGLFLSGLMLSSCASPTVSTSGLKERINYMNTIGMEFVKIPPGTFIMGANSKQEEAYSIYITHKMRLIS